MTDKTSKRFVARRILPRLVIAFCLFVGLAAVWIWQSRMEQASTHFIVQIPSKPPEQQTITQNRDLSDYDLGDSFSTCPFVDDEEFQQCGNAQDKGRDFIWNHWKSKKRGYIVYEIAGTRDAGFQVNVFIEPDENGTWHIVQRWRKSKPYISLNDYYEVESTDSIFIKRKRATTEDDRLRGGKFYLSFLDNDGNEVDTL